MSVKIITDSGCDLDRQQLEALDVILVSMTVHFGNEEYRSGIDLCSNDFYDKLAAAHTLPTTSQPTPYDFATAYAQACGNGDEAVVLCISSTLSGTYQSAVIAAEDYGSKIHVVDTKAVSVAQKALLDYAIALRNAGASASEIAAEIEKAKHRVRVFGVVDTLEYLIRGGRLSKAAGAVGSVLGIRPLLTLTEGALTVAGKARGHKAAVAMVAQRVKEAEIDFTMPTAIGYTGKDPSVLDHVLSVKDAPWSDQALPIYQVGSTVGTHAGPGAFILAFFEKS